MNKLFNYILHNFEKIYIIFLFLISFAIIVYIFPGEGKFRYEFHKGHPWLHKDLIAPFDFAIFKLDEELDAEKKEALHSFSPIYYRDNRIAKSQIDGLKKEFALKWKSLKAEQDSLKRMHSRKRTIDYQPDSVNAYFDEAVQIYQYIYQQGIIQFDEKVDTSAEYPLTLKVINNKIASEINYSSVFTLKSAYIYLIKNLDEKNTLNKTNPNLEFVKSLTFDKYLSPNLIYDKLRTEKARHELIDGISDTKGMVTEGERIISKGEMIDLDKYRKIESLKREYLNSMENSANRYLFLIGRIIIALFAFTIIYLFIKRFREYVLESRKKTFFILLLMVFFIFITDIVHNLSDINIYLIPFIIVPILITTFYETRLALFVHLITILLAAFYAPNSFEFIFIQFFAGIIAIIGLKKIQKRSQFFSATLLAVLSYFVLYFGFAINQEGNVKSIEWINFAWFAGNGILVLLSFPMVYVFEKTFNFVSEISLLELSDTNQKLLRELAEKAPGTFQHSMQVANLAEEVIRIIGGNAMLARTGALYHDIGKLSNPQYFTENQVSGMNPHSSLPYTESAAIIINHVTSGYEMAKKAKLPASIIDFILTHHGTTKTEYFYRLYKKENPDDEFAAEKFSYPGPKPTTKETAVLMMSDSIEAASRSLKQYDKQTISDLVESMIDFQIKEKQYDNASITFAEINEAKKIIKNKLNNIYHARIEYPKA